MNFRLLRVASATIKKKSACHDRHRRGGSVRLCPAAAASRVHYARARHAHSALLRCAWLRAALDAVVRSASLAMIVKVARNGDQTNNPLYWTFEVPDIAYPTCHPISSPCGKRRRSACEPLFRSARVVKDGPLAARVAGRRSLTTRALRNPCDHRIDGAVGPAGNRGHQIAGIIGTVTILMAREKLRQISILSARR